MKKNFPQNLNDWTEYRGMVHWFSPLLLLKTAKKVVDSTLFGQYADRRLVHAALDSPIDEDRLIENFCGGQSGVCRGTNQTEFLVDYVADLGDGFDSTYAIAYLIGQKEIEVGDALKLPRADCLVMGGDQVYPDASREEYKVRMQRPYRAAFPRSSREGACHPPVYLIPGNHDWYDGLNLFLANFCRGRETPLGSWVGSQHRSYFTIHLRENWWIWGFDSQLGEDIDKPQADYFTAVARKMPSDAKIILCASVPTWLKADLAGDKKGQDEYYRGLHYIASVARNECINAKIPLVISGDLHHYSRYVGKETGTHFITAGGGGAFLHPTHHLNDRIIAKWAGGSEDETLEIASITESDDSTKAIYPPQQVSRRLSLWNLLFWYKNPDFCLILGVLYWVCGLLMLMWNGYGEGTGSSFSNMFWTHVGKLAPTPVFVIVSFTLIAALFVTAEITASRRKLFIAPLHALFHIAIALFGTALVTAAAGFFGFQDFILGEIVYFFALMLGMLSLGFLGGFVWGIYLTVVCFWWGDHANGAFSAMRLNSYRHFVRLKIEGDRITIYPIGIDASPGRNDWKMNPDYDDLNPDQDTPAIVPTESLEPHLIEPPIVIESNDLTPLQPRRRL